MALVELETVTKRFGPDRPPATDRLSFTVESGRILALLGPRDTARRRRSG